MNFVSDHWEGFVALAALAVFAVPVMVTVVVNGLMLGFVCLGLLVLVGVPASVNAVALAPVSSTVLALMSSAVRA